MESLRDLLRYTILFERESGKVLCIFDMFSLIGDETLFELIHERGLSNKISYCCASSATTETIVFSPVNREELIQLLDKLKEGT
jgi:hypothetical protein